MAKGKKQGRLKTWFKSWCKKRRANRPIAQNPSPHKSFRKTHRHAIRADRLEKPAEYFSILTQTFRMILSRKRLFFGIVFLLMFANIITTGFIGDERYNTIADLFNDESIANLGAFGSAVGTLVTTVTQGGLNPSPTVEQRLMTTFSGTLAFMATIYAARQILAKHKPTLRSTLYNCFQPLVPCLLVLIVALVQLIPVLVVYIVSAAATQTGFLLNPFYALLFFGFSALLLLLSYHLALPTIIALVGVTAPGMYPMQAIANATDLIRGKRFSFVLFIFIGLLTFALLWLITFVPIVMFDQWLGSVWNFWLLIPFAPLVWQFLTFSVIMFISAYIYIYYRRLIDEFRPRPF